MRRPRPPPPTDTGIRQLLAILANACARDRSSVMLRAVSKPRRRRWRHQGAGDPRQRLRLVPTAAAFALAILTPAGSESEGITVAITTTTTVPVEPRRPHRPMIAWSVRNVRSHLGRVGIACATMSRDDRGDRRMTRSAHDVAAELRRRLPELGVTQMHKLLYYCQGWSLAFRGRPMFRETIRACTHGPVVASVWADEKHGRPTAEPADLEGDDLSILSYVASRYGRLSAGQLSEMTHGEAPWKEVSEQDSEWSLIDDDIISIESIRRYFTGLDEVIRADAIAREHADAIRPRIADDDRGSTADDPGRIRRRLNDLRR